MKVCSDAANARWDQAHFLDNATNATTTTGTTSVNISGTTVTEDTTGLLGGTTITIGPVTIPRTTSTVAPWSASPVLGWLRVCQSIGHRPIE